jgi:hypothetical protein
MYIVVLLPMVSSRYGKYSCCKVRFIIIIGLFQWSLVDMKNTIVVRFGLFEIGAPNPYLISLAPFIILKIPLTSMRVLATPYNKKTKYVVLWTNRQM